MATRLKICGIVRAEDLRACVEIGVDAVGLNLWPGSKRHVSLERAAELLVAAGLAGGARPPGGPAIVGVFVDPEPELVARACDRLALDAVQLHGDRSRAAYPTLACPWIRVVRGTSAIAPLAVAEPAPAWTLLDAATAGYGGAGVTTDWAWAADVVRQLAPHPVWLAGGIGVDNAAQAIATVAPAGIDVASGAELGAGATPGWKSRARIAALAAICGTLGP
jgi:phosphoribosylanthranilate isomerase